VRCFEAREADIFINLDIFVTVLGFLHNNLRIFLLELEEIAFESISSLLGIIFGKYKYYLKVVQLNNHSTLY